MVTFRYRGREIHPGDILYVRALIEQHPTDSRRKLSTRLCEDWDWRQSNGELRDMVCRGLLLMLERAGEIALPPVTYKRHNPLAQRSRPAPVLLDQTPIEAKLNNIGPVEFEQVRRTADEPLFNSLMEEHHYLGYEQPVGEHLKYLVWAHGRPLACLAWSSAPRHLGSRDRYIGWSAETRRRNIRFLAYNTRFLILPWVRVEHLASHILGRMASRISADWQRMYGHPIYFLETFIGPERFRGTCYRAAKWVVIRHQSLKHGERCSECRQGNVYAQKDPKVLVRIVGQAPLAATVYSLERLRCGACGQVFTAEEPEGVGPEKYDETAAAMIAQLKYGSGIPFYRLERLEDQLGIPLPAATQWEIVEEAAEVIKPARDELILRRRKGMYCTTTIPACEC